MTAAQSEKIFVFPLSGCYLQQVYSLPVAHENLIRFSVIKKTCLPLFLRYNNENKRGCYDELSPFFFHFSYKGLLGRFVCFNLSARELPLPLELAIAPGRGKDLLTIANQCRNHFNCFQVSLHLLSGILPQWEPCSLLVE